VFRAYSSALARRKRLHPLGLSGWVKNRPNGQVEAVFEGEVAALDKMLAWCRQGPALARVTDVDIREEPYAGTFDDFRILY